MNQISFQTLKKNLKKDFSNFNKYKVAVLGDSATQMYVQALKGFGYSIGVNYDIYEAEYDQIERQVYDLSSDLYSFNPDFVVVIKCVNKLNKKFNKNKLSDKSSFAEKEIAEINNIYRTINKSLKCKVIYFNYSELNDCVFGNFANKTNVSFLYQLRKLNYELMNLSQAHKNLFVLDLNSLQANFGREFITDHKIYVNTDLFFSIDVLPIVANNTSDIIQAIEGKFKKCVILDLDNTLWGGIIGDDGIENIQIGDLGIGKAFTEFQLWVKQLKQRGIILAVCSKNDEHVAKEPFEKHPEMVLRLDDIAVFVANWNNKVDNIKYIQSILNIGFDSMVFLDDNPFERNMVRTHIADICVPELPEDPAEYLNYIRTLNLFETASFTHQDELRTIQYQEEANRTILQHQFTDEKDFLRSLEMVSIVEPFTKFNTPRVAQLTQRSNQFNLRTIRYTEDEIAEIANNTSKLTFAFSLSDKYGDYGLISLVILNEMNANILFVDTWIMSCRVLKRNMENFVLNFIVSEAKSKGYSHIYGEYLPTPKNSIVKDHYANLGFVFDNNLWNLSISDYIKRNCYIEIKNNNKK